MAPETNSTTKIPASSSLLDSERSSLPTQTRNALLSHLQESTAIPRLNSLLIDSLARAGWTDRVHELALELLRSGQCVTLGEVLEEVSRRACQGLSSTNGATSEDALTDVRIPKETIEKSVRFLREEIEGVIEVVHDDKSGGTAANGLNGHKGR